ncbi:LOW QUALITY PROTEIN: sodium/potassium/calcium exchanger Nckx30C-like, partial [Tachypleus tridentatus]|uniref:LOW QUALITY PROTEIN: sodium/potassium/calcium exchanger Nckx30C-like n=1 Tax=Tachypleus tridentatus TaxID=6853 RepID=UPI003FCFBA60
KGDPNITKPPPQFPPDLFTETQRKHGAVILHVLGLVYMFAALAIVCDEFFIPSLDVITEKLEISEDVAGATFMAAGGSAPELFTSIIGVFISFDDVGIGTIVGSAVFNILFVISMCAIFSKSVLQLTWWPLFRDVSFYSIILIILIMCFRDNVIYWYESLILLFCYACYVTFMKFNEPLEKLVKKILNRNKVTRVDSKDHLMPSHIKRRMSTPILHAGTKFRQGLLQLMIHSIDPLHEGKLDEKASQLHAIASLRVLLDATKSNSCELQNGAIVVHTTSPTDKEYPVSSTCPTCETSVNCMCNGVQPISTATALADIHNHVTTPETKTVRFDEDEDPHREAVQRTEIENTVSSLTSLAENSLSDSSQTNPVDDDKDDNNDSLKKKTTKNITSSSSYEITADTGQSTSAGSVPAQMELPLSAIPEQEQSTDTPLDMSWPDTWRKRLNYILLGPIIIPLWLTLPDVRKEKKRRWFAISFIGSICWIAFFSYLMVWWASLTGETAGIPNEVMGLTFLAAGTSIPDLITSVLVARKGFGDMAVSSSIGSNIFDVAMGLPLPWFVASILFGPVQVSSTGMACSVLLLFLMLLFVIVSIACFKWRMNTKLAAVMFVLYFVFITLSLLLEYKVISCNAILKPFTG